MNKFFTIAFGVYCIISVQSQAQKPEMIEINPHSFDFDKKLPFDHVDVIDSRFDTTKIGYIPKSFSFKKFTVAPALSVGIQANLNTSLKIKF